MCVCVTLSSVVCVSVCGTDSRLKTGRLDLEKAKVMVSKKVGTDTPALH